MIYILDPDSHKVAGIQVTEKTERRRFWEPGDRGYIRVLNLAIRQHKNGQHHNADGTPYGCRCLGGEYSPEEIRQYLEHLK